MRVQDDADPETCQLIPQNSAFVSHGRILDQERRGKGKARLIPWAIAVRLNLSFLLPHSPLLSHAVLVVVDGEKRRETSRRVDGEIERELA